MGYEDPSGLYSFRESSPTQYLLDYDCYITVNPQGTSPTEWQVRKPPTLSVVTNLRHHIPVTSPTLVTVRKNTPEASHVAIAVVAVL